jgi:hypothetical protein
MNEVYERAIASAEHLYATTMPGDNVPVIAEYSQYHRYEYRPLYVSVPCGFFAVVLMVGQFFVPYPTWMVGAYDLTGVLRLLMIFLGAYLIFFAWPRYRYLGISPEEESATEELRDRMRQRRRF